MRFFEPLIRKDPQYRHGIWFSAPSPSRLIFVEQGQIVSVKGSTENELFESFLEKINAFPPPQLSFALSKRVPNESFIQTLKNLGFLPKQKLQELQKEWVEHLLVQWIQDESISWKFEPVNHASERWDLDIQIDRVVLSSFILRRSMREKVFTKIKIRLLQHQFKHLLVGNLESMKSILISHDWITYSQLISGVNKPEELWGLIDYLKLTNQIEIKEEIDLESDKKTHSFKQPRSFTRSFVWSLIGSFILAIIWNQFYPNQSEITDSVNVTPPIFNQTIREPDHWTIIINIQADESLLSEIKSDFGDKFSLHIVPISPGSKTFQISLGDFASYSEALEIQTSLDLARRTYSNGWGVRRIRDLQ